MIENNLEILLDKYSSNDINKAEFNELCRLINEPENDIALKAALEQGFKEADLVEIEKGRLHAMLLKILKPKLNETKVVKMFDWRRVAAAAVIFFLSLGSYLVFKYHGNKEIASNGPQKSLFKNDIAAPAKAKATITLADGRVVPLDSINSGTLVLQGSLNVVKTSDGKIIYKGTSSSLLGEENARVNTLTNPRGSSVINMIMSDGSQVWLNAGSSITYPVTFNGKERKVEMTGEAYFEISHNPSRPFKVSVAGGKEEVEVLGTHFNINSFVDEITIKTTLLQGSVRINLPSTLGEEQGVKLLTGQQSVYNPLTKQPIFITSPDMEQVMAWKNGFFDCNGLNIEAIMKQLARWYDVEVTFKCTLQQDKFVGRIPRTVSLVNVLKVLELNGIHFIIDGKKIIVL